MFVRRRSFLFLCAATLVMAGCASSRAPRGWLPSNEDAARSPYGGWVSVEFFDEEGRKLLVGGELISVDADSIRILSSGGSHVLATKQIVDARVEGYRIHPGMIGGWAVAGTLATLSHGYYLIFTAPAWILAGSLASASESRAPFVEFGPAGWEKAVPFARFPAGMPSGVDFNRLKPRS